MAYCSRCDRYFGSENALKQHKDNSRAHNICSICDRDFISYQAFVSHRDTSPVYYYSQACDEYFQDEDELEDELEDYYEDNHYYCKLCHKVSCTPSVMGCANYTHV